MTRSKATWTSIPVLLFVALALLRTDLVLHLGWLIRGWALVALLAFSVLVLPLFRSQGTSAFYLAMVTHLLLYLACLAGTWVTGATSDLVVSGIFPFSDAAGYFQDAIFLIAGRDLVYSNRPLFTGLLATGLGWTDLNLKLVLIFFSATASIAAFLFAKQVARGFGLFTGFVVLCFIFWFYRRFLGTLLTENLGLTLGLLGTALLLQSLRAEKYEVVLGSSGLFVLTMALFARAGAFLVLPAILLYFWHTGRINHRSLIPRNWYSVAGGLTAIVIAVGCNSLLRQWTGASQNVLFGNAAFSLYGMAAGYKGWSQIFRDHPEFYGSSNPVFINQILEATWTLIQHQPLQLAKAVVLSFGDFFVRVFGFAKFNFLFQDFREHLILNLIVVSLLNLCLFAGVFRLWKCRAEIKEARLLLFAFTGIVLSAPFVPPIDADSMRAYAATFPFVALITGIGMASVFGLGPWREAAAEGPVIPIAAILSASVISIALLGPSAVRGAGTQANFELQKLCSANEKSYVFQTHPALAVHVLEDSGQGLKEYYPSTTVDIDFYRKNLDFNHYLVSREQLKIVAPGSTIFVARELEDDHMVFFLAATAEVANKKGIFSGCSDSLQIAGNFTLVKIHSLQELSTR
jgi:hypothetical protein